MTDRELLGAYARGSQEAFSELVDRHAGRVYGACLRVLGNAHHAEDATQAVFLVLARKAAGLAGSGMLAGWLHTVARDTARNLLREETRRRRREKEAAMQAGSRTHGGESLPGAMGATGGRLDAALAALPAAQRQVLLLRHCYGRTEAEVAEELGWSRSRISVTLSRALAALRSGLVRRGVAVPAAAALGAMLAAEAGAGAAAVPPALLAALKGIGLETAAGAIPAKVASLAEGTMRAMTMAKVKLAAAVMGCVLAVGGGGGFLAARLAAGEALTPSPLPGGEGPGAGAERKGPLAGLPSEPRGEHLAKIKALGDNAWVDLGSPAPDPKWGKARGRTWSPVAPYAPDLRGAFVFGEGPHGMVKPNGHYHDDLWFYDVNQHRWICVYPGIHAAAGYKEIKFDEKTGFEVTPDGQPIPIATMVHAYSMVTYDTDRGLFMNMGCSGGYWRPGYHKGITGRVEALKERTEELEKAKGAGKTPAWSGSNGTSPYIYNARTGRFERYRTPNPGSAGGFGATLIYVPSVKKAFGYKNRNSPAAWYDPETKDWTEIKKKGNVPPWGIDPNVCYDSKRDRIYLAGGIYAAKGQEIKPGESALWMFDVKTETFSRLEPKVNPTPTSYATNRAMFFYDSVNDVVVLFFHRSRDAEVPGIYVYHPEKNEWEVVAERPPELKQGDWGAPTGFYDPELNAHIMHAAGDGRDNGTMWAYRYKRAPGGGK